MKVVSLTVLAAIAMSISQVWTSQAWTSPIWPTYEDEKTTKNTSKENEHGINSPQRETKDDKNNNVKEGRYVYTQSPPSNMDDYKSSGGVIDCKNKNINIEYEISSNPREKKYNRDPSCKSTSKESLVSHAKFLVGAFKGKLEKGDDEGINALKVLVQEANELLEYKKLLNETKHKLVCKNIQFSNSKKGENAIGKQFIDIENDNNNSNNNNNSEMSDDDIEEKIFIEEGLEVIITKAEIRSYKAELEEFKKAKNEFINAKLRFWGREWRFAVKDIWKITQKKLKAGCFDILKFVKENKNTLDSDDY